MTEKEFTSLVPELRQTALHVCRDCGTDGMTAEDVAQDTMLRLWAIRKDITSAQHAKGMTGCVAKHFCIDRHRKKREVSLLLHPHLQAESHEPPPDMMMETQENDMWLQQKLLELPSTQYQVLHLRQVEKKSMEEIAGIIGITPASAATILSRARQRMLTEIRRRMEISRE